MREARDPHRRRNGRPGDLAAARDLAQSGALSLDGLITHRRAAREAPQAYPQAFGDPACVKMVLDWSAT